MARKPLLLRIPETLHRRLHARARREGRSINAVATDVLDAAVDADARGRLGELRSAAAAAGLLWRHQAGPMSAGDRQRIIEATRGRGPILDELLADERDRV